MTVFGLCWWVNSQHSQHDGSKEMWCHKKMHGLACNQTTLHNLLTLNENSHTSSWLFKSLPNGIMTIKDATAGIFSNKTNNNYNWINLQWTSLKCLRVVQTGVKEQKKTAAITAGSKTMAFSNCMCWDIWLIKLNHETPFAVFQPG